MVHRTRGSPKHVDEMHTDLASQVVAVVASITPAVFTISIITVAVVATSITLAVFTISIIPLALSTTKKNPSRVWGSFLRLRGQ